MPRLAVAPSGAALAWLLRRVPVEATDQAWAAVAAVLAAAGDTLVTTVQLFDRVLAIADDHEQCHRGVGMMVQLAAIHKGPCMAPRGSPALVRWYGVMAGMVAGHGGEINPRLTSGVTALHIALRKNGAANGVVALVLLALGADPWVPSGPLPPPAVVINEVAAAEAAIVARDFRPRAMSSMATSVSIFGVVGAAIWTLADVVGPGPGARAGQELRALAAMAAIPTPLVVAPATGTCSCGAAALVAAAGRRCCIDCAAKLPSAAAAAAARMVVTDPLVPGFLLGHRPAPGTELAVGVAILRARCNRAARAAVAIAAVASGRAGVWLPMELWSIVYGMLVY